MFEIDINMNLSNGGSRGFRLRTSFRAEGRRLVLFGPSGSGKTMTLRAVAGLSDPDQGRIRINGRSLFDSSANLNLPPRNRRVGFIFQDYALFPHMTVRENIGFGLGGIFKRPRGQERERVEELIEIFGLESVAGSRPSRISGGQKQRAALARGLASKPDLLLLDEPFSALDAPLRERMRSELSRTLELFNLPLILVTHDIEELTYFADTAVIMHQGRVVAVEGENMGRVDQARVQGAVAQAYSPA